MNVLADLKRFGESLGLIGTELGTFITEQQTIQREERDKERVLEKAKLDQEYRMAELQANNSPQPSSVTYKTPKITLPPFEDGDDISAYLSRFESIARQFQWPDEVYSVQLSSLLKNKRALDIYSTLSDDIRNDYNELKTALMVGFKCTADFYRKQFRSLKACPEDTYTIFVEKLKRFLRFWLKSAEVEESYESLFDFIVEDQVKASCGLDLRTFLKEQQCKGLEHLIALAEAYVNAHGATIKEKSKKKDGTFSHSSKPNQYSGPHKGPPVNTNKEKFFRDKANYTSGNYTSPKEIKPIKCHACGDMGHIQRFCPRNPSLYPKIEKSSVQNLQSTQSTDESPAIGPSTKDPSSVNLAQSEQELGKPGKKLVFGMVNGTPVSTIMRDTGADCILVSDRLLPDITLSSSRTKKISDYLGRTDHFPVVKCYIECQFYTGWADVVRAPLKHCSVLIGDVPGARSPDVPFDIQTDQPLLIDPDIAHVQVTTRAQAKKIPLDQSSNKDPSQVNVNPLCPMNITPVQFRHLQETCQSLKPIYEKANEMVTDITRSGSEFKYVFVNHLLYRQCIRSRRNYEVGQRTLVIPSSCRNEIMKLAHDSPLAGHFSHRKTLDKVLTQFYWPGAPTEIQRYCQSCAICQRCSQGGRVKKVPMIAPTISKEPFDKVAIDIVGPIHPPSSLGHKFILTVVDWATRFPEAIPLRNIDSISVAEALVTIFSRVGIPREILSDQGRQFVSDLMGEVHKLLATKPVFTAPYHPQSNGICERFNGVLKTILRKVCTNHPRQWHNYIAPALFAVREMPHGTLKFSPFELLYGRQVRGPLSILRELWSNDELREDLRTTYQYVFDLRQRLEESARIAAQHADISGALYKQYFDKSTRRRRLNIGDEVLLLLPTSNNKLLMQWKGPYRVIDRRNYVDYIIEIRGRPRLFHINMLKKFVRRGQVNFLSINSGEQLETLPEPSLEEIQPISTQNDWNNLQNEHIVQVSLIEENRTEFEGKILTLENDEVDPNYNPNLTIEQQAEIKTLVSDFHDVVSSKPGLTSTYEHTIHLTCTEPIRKKTYPIPLHLREEFDQEVDRLFELQIISPSHSPYCSPVVMVRKPNNTWRLCIDFRAINSVTQFDAEPMPLIDEELYRFSGAKYITELDLCKAYFQLPLSRESRKLTAFATNKGLMEFNCMPFGLSTACASYARLMRIVLSGLPIVACYFDNVYIYSRTWSEHVDHIRSVLDRFRQHKLTVGPDKCFFGFSSISYLGVQVGSDLIRPLSQKISAISELMYPKTKKQMRSFVGMASFYRKFIPNFATISASLTDHLKKGESEPLIATNCQLEDFKRLKEALTKEPVLSIPKLNEEFVVRCDASNVGLGSVLLQEDSTGVTKPVAYASRKLLPRETKYSTIERECLALVWAVEKFEVYLYGKKFILETDHRALQYLKNFTGKNSRVLRWALSLQPYHFSIRYIRGSENHGPDLLSRADS